MYGESAKGVISTFGDTTSVKLIKVSQQGFDPVTGTFSNSVRTETDVLCVVNDVPDELVDGTRILTGDKRLVFPYDVTIDKDDIIEILGVEYKILSINAPRANDQAILQKVMCRA